MNYSQPLRNTGIRNMTKIGRTHVSHLLKEYISLWCIYLSLLDKNSLKAYYRMFPSWIGHLGWRRAHLPLLRTIFLQSWQVLTKTNLLLAPFKLDLASWKKKKAALWCFHVVNMHPSGEKPDKPTTCGARYHSMGICNCIPSFCTYPWLNWPSTFKDSYKCQLEASPTLIQ